MTAAAERSTAEPRTFGNWQKPRSPGLVPRLGITGSVVLLVGMLLVLLTAQTRGFLPGLAVFLVLVLALLPAVYRSPAGRNGWQVAAGQGFWALGKARGQNVYLSGKVPPRNGEGEPVAFGQHRLPGLLASSRLLEVQTPAGQPVGLVHVPAARHYTVLLEISPEGDALVDEATVDAWVAGWASWLGDLGHEPGLVAAVVTVETAPDPGHRLAAEVNRQLADGCPPFAARVLRDCAANYPVAAPDVTARIALTFTAKRDDLAERELLERRSKAGRSRNRGHTEMGQLITSRLPGLLAALVGTGAGAVRLMAAQDIAAVVRVAYDPAAADDLDAQRAHGDPAPISWDEAGPVAAMEEFGSYRHDSAASVTWAMVAAPRGAVTSRVLSALLGPAQGAVRKRVTLTYRPHRAGDAASIVDSDVRTAVGRESARAGEARATETAALAAARQTAKEEARGAGLTRFALLVTVTADPTALAEVTQQVDQLGRASRLRLRRCYGTQAAAFAAALGVGIVLPAHVSTTLGGAA